MKIAVSARDIKLGLKTTTSHTKCPVARAIRRAGLKGVGVGIDWAKSKYGRIRLPKEAVYAIAYMCAMDTMKPFSFSLTQEQVDILHG